MMEEALLLLLFLLLLLQVFSFQRVCVCIDQSLLSRSSTLSKLKLMLIFYLMLSQRHIFRSFN